MTLQELFDIVWERAKDKRKAINHAYKGGDDFAGPQCMYRTPDGCKCFIGAAIPDDKYDPRFDDADGIVDSECGTDCRTTLMVVMKVIGIPLDLRYAVKSLQAIHDNVPVEDWEQSLRSYAQSYELTVPEMTDV